MIGEVSAVVSTSSSLAGRPGQKGSPSRETEQEEQLGQSVSRPWVGALRPGSLQCPARGAWCLPWEGEAHFCFSLRGNKSQLQLGPVSRLEPITRRGSGSLQPAVRTPDARLAQRVSDCW